MSVANILKNQSHRPWKIPSGSWKYYQEWNNAVFLHYQVELKNLQAFVPDELEIELFNSKPWVSIVAFTMEKIRPKILPSFNPISNFDEINIRTYVKANNKSGVYFLSIEAGKVISCKIAQLLSKLPYRHSYIERKIGHFNSFNKKYNDKLNLEYTIKQEKQNRNDLDLWLTERYALFHNYKNTIIEFNIHHLMWPLKEIQINNININYERFHSLIHSSPELSHYSKGVKVLAWGKEKL